MAKRSNHTYLCSHTNTQRIALLLFHSLKRCSIVLLYCGQTSVHVHANRKFTHTHTNIFVNKKRNWEKNYRHRHTHICWKCTQTVSWLKHREKVYFLQIDVWLWGGLNVANTDITSVLKLKLNLSRFLSLPLCVSLSFSLVSDAADSDSDSTMSILLHEIFAQARAIARSYKWVCARAVAYSRPLSLC